MLFVSLTTDAPTAAQINGAKLIVRKMDHSRLEILQKSLKSSYEFDLLLVPAPSNLQYTKMMLDSIDAVFARRAELNKSNN